MNKDEALKMAIEALEHAELVFYITKDDGSKVSIYAETITACKEALNIANCDLKQPAQEPVATVRSYNGLVGFHANQKQINILKDKHEHPLYLHPAQTWQGLSDEERIKCYETSGHKQHIRPQDKFAVLELSIAIEQALKEKNI